MEVYNLEFIESVVTEFFRGNGKIPQECLNNIQMSKDAWYFIWELLEPRKTKNIQFFAASTLYMKIKMHWSEVAVENYETLKIQIIEAIVQHHKGEKSVLSKLCVSMAAYVTKVFPYHWPNAIADLISIFKDFNNEMIESPYCSQILLEILTLLPEQVLIIHVIPDKNIMNELENNIAQVIDLINYFLGAASCSQLHEQASVCAYSWLSLQLPFSTFLQLAENLITVIINTAEIDSKTSTMDAALRCLKSLVTHNEIHETALYLDECWKELLKLQGIIPPVNASRHETAHYQILELFVVVSEYHSENILMKLLNEGESKEIATKVINMVMKATEVPGRYSRDESLSIRACCFWNNFLDVVTEIDLSKEENTSNLIIPICTYLVDVLLKKFAIADDFDEWNSEDKEKFHYFRRDIINSYTYCYQILNERMLNILVGKMTLSVEKCEEKWQGIESVLHAWSAIADMVPVNTQQLNSVFDLFKKIPLCKLDMNLQLTTITCIGNLVKSMNNNSTYLLVGISVVLDGLHSPSVALCASRVLKYIVRKCQDSIQPFANEIIPILQNTVTFSHLNIIVKTLLTNTLGQLQSLRQLEKNPVLFKQIH